MFDLEENLAPLKDFDCVEIEQVDEPEKRITNVKVPTYFCNSL